MTRTESPRYELVTFDERSPAPARDLARLHAALLPESPVPLLGEAFMERFYYSVLPAEGSVRGAVAYCDGEPAGFIAVTHDPRGFMRSAVRRHWARIGWLIATSLLRSPRRIAYVLEALRLMSASKADERDGGQILSFGVLPAYREFRFVRRTGLRLGLDLLRVGVDQLRAFGVREIRAAVHRDNREAQLFYRGLGWRLTGKDLPGWRVPAVELTWSADEDAQTSDRRTATVEEAQ
ncbi:MAG: hypothetical protein WBE98_03215 [Gammaproteobacteria bacterium]|nr:hypothetical protein [Gammaproteobacteria bacterium]